MNLVTAILRVAALFAAIYTRRGVVEPPEMVSTARMFEAYLREPTEGV